jgi:hypothetical protein
MSGRRDFATRDQLYIQKQTPHGRHLVSGIQQHGIVSVCHVKALSLSATHQSTRSKSPGFHVLSNQGSNGA